MDSHEWVCWQRNEKNPNGCTSEPNGCYQLDFDFYFFPRRQFQFMKCENCVSLISSVELKKIRMTHGSKHDKTESFLFDFDTWIKAWIKLLDQNKSKSMQFV